MEEKENGNIANALDVRKALASRNYHRLFRLYNSAPNMGGYLMDFFVERERVAACCIICKSYVPLVSPFTQVLPLLPLPSPIPLSISHPFLSFDNCAFTVNGSYRPEIEVRFITDELGFESDAECVEFLEKRNPDIFSDSGGGLKIKTKEALESFEVDRRKLFRVVDIKGQI